MFLNDRKGLSQEVEVGASLSFSFSFSHTHTHPPTVVHSPAHPVVVSSMSQEHPLSTGLWLPASILVIVILPDLLARSWRQESPSLHSTSPSWLPPTPRIIQTSCCKVPCLLSATIHSHLPLPQPWVCLGEKGPGCGLFWRPLRLCMGSHWCIK